MYTISFAINVLDIYKENAHYEFDSLQLIVM